VLAAVSAAEDDPDMAEVALGPTVDDAPGASAPVWLVAVASGCPVLTSGASDSIGDSGSSSSSSSPSKAPAVGDGESGESGPGVVPIEEALSMASSSAVGVAAWRGTILIGEGRRR
jgi:hypothetical protein